LQPAYRVGCTRKTIIDKGYAVTNEDAGFEGDAFTNKGVAANLAMVPDRGPFLNFHESADLGLVADFATIKVDESVDAHVSTKGHVRRNPAVIWYLSIDTTEFG
jgi:hypothetical protein